jgi:hypothetical protein
MLQQMYVRRGLKHLLSRPKLKHPIGSFLKLLARKNLSKDFLTMFANKKKQT